MPDRPETFYKTRPGGLTHGNSVPIVTSMGHYRDTPNRPPTGRGACALLLAGCVLACVLATPGCDSTTEPDTDPNPFTFLPAGGSANVPLGGHLDFRVEGPDLKTASVTWTSERYGAASGVRFRYQGTVLEDDVLRAVVTSGGASHTHAWSVDVTPGGRDLVVFTPAPDDPPVFAGLPETFGAASAWGTPTVTWSVNGTMAGTGAEYVLDTGATGPLTLSVAVALGDTVLGRTWSLDVRPLDEALPGSVAELRALPGAVRGEVRLVWGPSAASVFPIDYYEIRLNTDGPVTDANWDGLQPLYIVNHDDGAAEFATAVPSHLTGFTGGETVWCGVRCSDERDLRSLAVSVETTVIDGRWWATGAVRDHLGDPLADVDVTADTAPATLSAPDGTYRLGPFEMGETPVITAMTPLASPQGESWHAGLSHPLDPGAPEWGFLLLPRYGCDPGCYSFDTNFVAYFRSLTNTLHPTDDRPNTDLYKWESYPVPVHVPEFLSPDNVDFASACRAMVQAWNDNLGADFLVLEPDPALAAIIFAYELDETGLYGRADLDQPGNGGLVLGTAIPERVTVRLQPTLPNELSVQAVALHELGHALGLYGHAYCAAPNYLMWLGGINPYERPPAESIHIDEIRAVRLIRELPQGLEMAAYPTNEP